MMRVVESTGRPFNGSDTILTKWSGYYDPTGERPINPRDGWELPDYNGTYYFPWWGVLPPHPNTIGAWDEARMRERLNQLREGRSLDGNDLASNPTPKGLETQRELDEKRKATEKWAAEIESNEKVFKGLPAKDLNEKYGDISSLYFLMKSAEIVGVFESESEALKMGKKMYGKLDNPYFSIHSVATVISLM